MVNTTLLQKPSQISLFLAKVLKSPVGKDSLCYNLYVDLKELMQTYQAGWKAVEEIQREERRSASADLRWRQLNTVYGFAKELKILRPDPTEAEVIQRWATLKDQATCQKPKT